MTESDLKRYLIRSLRAQNGVGHRMEDKYAVGWPDLILIPEVGPVFFAEAKLLKKVKACPLHCTEMQERRLDDLRRPPMPGGYFCHAVMIGYHAQREALYIGEPWQVIDQCRYVGRPARLDSADWEISFLLTKYHLDKSNQDSYSKLIAE